MSTTTNTFRATYPIDFDLYDKDSQNVLYIEDSSDQLLTLEIRNASNRDIVLNDLGTAPLSATNYHFALRFRPGTIAKASLTGSKAIQLTNTSAKGNWEMLLTQHDSENWDVIYLRKTTAHLLKCATATEKDPWQSIVFNHVGADACQGPRGTRVQLVCANMHYQGSAEPINTMREKNMGIINHRGKKTVPWQLGFVGGNTVVNDGDTKNHLTLRIANIAPYNILNQTQSHLTFRNEGKDDTKITKFFLSFQTGNDNDAWALDKDDVISKNITIGTLTGWNITPPQQDKKPVWVLWPEKTITLPSMEDPDPKTAVNSHLDIVINNIVSSFPCGQTHLYIYYQNIPGYWDGSVACIIEKTPIKVDQKLVEIDSSLTIKNGSAGIVTFTKEDVNVQTTLTCRSIFQINGPGDSYIDIGNPDQKMQYVRIGAYANANNIENHDRPLLIYNKTKDGKTKESARFTTDGKVGIGGTSAPTAMVDVAPNKDMPALQLHNGNISNGTNENQITLGYNDTSTPTPKDKDTYRHAIKTRHDGNAGNGNAIDFYVWDQANDKDITKIGTKHTLSLNNGKVGIGGITDPNESLEVKGKIICALQGVNNNYEPGLTVNNGRIWSNYAYGGLLVGSDKNGFFGMFGPQDGVGIWHHGKGRSAGAWGLIVKQPDSPSNSGPEITIQGKLFIQVVEQLQEHETRYLVHKPSNNEIGWYDASDKRLKKNIATIPNALDAIQQLRGVSYQWNEEGLQYKTKEVEENYRAASNTPEDNASLWEREKQRIRQENARTFNGFIAQEVETVFPDWVKEDKDGYKTINMDELAPVMVEALKTQQQHINTLQAQINMLMKEVEALKNNL